MTRPDAEDVTQLLLDWEQGDPSALSRLMTLVYGELHRLAEINMQRERRDHTLQPTALIHELFLRLIDQRRVHWQNRDQFFGVAATLMRRVLVHHAEHRRAAKRGGGRRPAPFDEALAVTTLEDAELLALDEALEALAAFDPRQSRIVELRFFGGFTVAEIGRLLDISPATVKREWRLAKAWLHREMAAAGQ